MSTRTLPALSYVGICILLLLGTILSVSFSFMHMAPVWHTVVGLAIALGQAILVLLFSMHLILADKVHWSVVLVAVFWLGILLVLTYSDYFTRGIVPYSPGH